MEIGLLGLDDQYSIAKVVAAVEAAAAEGFETYWLPGEIDPISAVVAAGRAVPDIKLATSVIPIYSRHPVALAAEALLTNEAIGGRLILGLGLSHRPLVETKWGQPFDRPVRLLREYLQILVPLLEHGEVDFTGQMLSARTTQRVDVRIRPTVLIAAMGPQTLRVTGRWADGTDVWLTGPRTLAELTVPTITAAATAAGRPRPIIAAGLPVCVTTDVDDGLRKARDGYQHHAAFPTYQAMVAREGKAGPEDLAIVGDEEVLLARVLELRDIGVTHFIASPFGDERDIRTTRTSLQAVAREVRVVRSRAPISSSGAGPS